jgi:GAF domain-containing protein
MLAHAAVAAAQGILKERYRLASLEEGFELLRRTSQRHNVKLRTLSDVVIHIAGPDERTGAWFPHRARAGASRLPGSTSSTAPHGAVLGAGLRRVLEITETALGNVQLAEVGLLRLEKHSGLGRQFTDFFAFVDHSGTACAQAARDRRQVTIRDVASATVFDQDSRHVILHAGSRACHSVPLLDERGALLGVISSHHARPIAGFTRSQLAALHETADVVGRWLAWHRRTSSWTPWRISSAQRARRAERLFGPACRPVLVCGLGRPRRAYTGLPVPTRTTRQGERSSPADYGTTRPPGVCAEPR